MTKVKAHLLQPTSSDAGSYIGMRDVKWESIVEGELTGKNNNTLLVKGEEFIRVGGDPEMFVPELVYLWGCFLLEEEL